MIGAPGAAPYREPLQKTKGRGQVRFAHGRVIALFRDHQSGGQTFRELCHQNDPTFFMECTPSGQMEITLDNSPSLVKRF
jgi:hypothetical protein